MKFTNPLGRLLHHSPFKPLKSHMEVVADAIKCVPDFFEAFFAGESEKAKSIGVQIEALESKADEIKLNYRASMPSTLLMPVDRRDLLMLMAEQDRIADAANSVVGIFARREMKSLPAIREPLTRLIESSVDVFTLAFDLVEQIENLLEGGFKGREGRRAYDMISGIRQAEELNDEIGQTLAATLYSIESQLNPVDVMFWYRVFDKVEEISNKSENVGDRVLLLIAR